jgi:transposase
VAQVVTIVCKLKPTSEQAIEIEAVLEAFVDACNYANQTVKPSIASKSTIQTQTYYIHIQLKDQAPEPIQSDKVIGVDFGRRAVFVNPLGGSVLSCYLADHIRATESPRLLAVG